MAERVEQHRVGLERLDLAGAEHQRLLNGEPARGAGEQHGGVRDQRVRQRVEVGRRVGGVRSAGLRQGGDPAAVAIQPEGLRRAGDAQHAGVVGEVGVDALGEVVEQRVDAAGRAHLGHLLGVRRVQGGVDRLEIVVVRLPCPEQERASLAASASRATTGNAAGPEQGCDGQEREERRDELEGMDQEHQPEHERGPCPGPGQVVAVDQPDPVRVQHEAQADIEPGQEEERQQYSVIEGDVAELRRVGRGVLQLQRVERVDRGGPVAERGRQDQPRPAASAAAPRRAGPSPPAPARP